VGGPEGATYIWTRDEIASVPGADGAGKFFAVHGLTPLPEADAPIGAPVTGAPSLRSPAAAGS
jgi:hypothetical protein